MLLRKMLNIITTKRIKTFLKIFTNNLQIRLYAKIAKNVNTLKIRLFEKLKISIYGKAPYI